MACCPQQEMRSGCGTQIGVALSDLPPHPHPSLLDPHHSAHPTQNPPSMCHRWHDSSTGQLSGLVEGQSGKWIGSGLSKPAFSQAPPQEARGFAPLRAQTALCRGSTSGRPSLQTLGPSRSTPLRSTCAPVEAGRPWPLPRTQDGGSARDSALRARLLLLLLGRLCWS